MGHAGDALPFLIAIFSEFVENHSKLSWSKLESNFQRPSGAWLPSLRIGWPWVSFSLSYLTFSDQDSDRKKFILLFLSDLFQNCLTRSNLHGNVDFSPSNLFLSSPPLILSTFNHFYCLFIYLFIFLSNWSNVQKDHFVCAYMTSSKNSLKFLTTLPNN